MTDARMLSSHTLFNGNEEDASFVGFMVISCGGCEACDGEDLCKTGVEIDRTGLCNELDFETLTLEDAREEWKRMIQRGWSHYSSWNPHDDLRSWDGPDDTEESVWVHGVQVA